VSAAQVSFELLCRAFEAVDSQHDGPAPAALKIFSEWKGAARRGHEAHPVGTVAEFEELWPWYLTGMLYASTGATARDAGHRRGRHQLILAEGAKNEGNKEGDH
jgi:hypothetical protein